MRPNTEISYSWHVTTQVWVVPLIGCAMWKICFSQSEALPRSGYWISTLISQTSFHWETSSGATNVGFFSQPTAAVSISKGTECTCNDSAVGLHVEKWSSVWVAGADPGFFLGGCTRLLLYFNTNKPHSFFFLQNTSCIRKCTPCTQPLDPPLGCIIPCCPPRKYTDQVKQLLNSSDVTFFLLRF